MAVRTTMGALIARVRLLINDPAGNSPVFEDQDIQDVLDESRVDVFNQDMVPMPTFVGNSVQYLDYMTELGGWEDGYVIKQYLTNVVTPTVLEPISGHWSFATTTLPPLFITGRLFDVYRGAADLLERWSAQYALQFDFSSDGQSFKRSQAAAGLQKLALTYRMKQRAVSLATKRGDITSDASNVFNLGPQDVDYFASGDAGR